VISISKQSEQAQNNTTLKSYKHGFGVVFCAGRQGGSRAFAYTF
jgi:hypothetical protein